MSFLLGELAERWRIIPSAPEFLVSDHGNVRRASTGRPIAPYERDGYVRVNLLLSSGRLTHRHVASLVLEAFVGPRPSCRHHAAHAPDNNRHNNRLENLTWKLPTDNERDKREHGTEPKGGARQALGPRTVKSIRRRADSGESITRSPQTSASTRTPSHASCAASGTGRRSWRPGRESADGGSGARGA